MTGKQRLVAAVFGVFAVAVLITAIVAAGGSGGGDDSGLQQTQPVSSTGAALLPLGTNDTEIGKAAPVVTGSSFDGTAMTIGAAGTASLIVFVAHWCPHCQKEVPVIADWVNEVGLPAGLNLVSIATATTKDRPNYPPSAWLARERWPVPTMADDARGSAALAYGVNAYPFFVALDGRGRVVARASGELPVAEIQLLAERALAVK